MSGDKTDSRVARFWDGESSDWGQKYGRPTSYYYRRKAFQQYFAATRLDRASILDYGCGSGDITFPMLQAGHHITGVDIAEGMIRKAAERAAKHGLQSSSSYRLLNDAVLAEIGATKFDAVVCSSVLEYVEDDKSLLVMFRALLRDPGFLLVSVPDRGSLYCRLDRWMHANKHRLPDFVPVEKLGYLDIQKRQYDINRFVRDVEGLGFTLQAQKRNTITLQRGALMEKISNIPGVGMLALMMFRTAKPGG